jgi:hypothetical protein
VQSGPGAILPSKPQSFWTMYRKDGPPPPEPKMQRVLSGMLEAKSLATLMDSIASSKRDQQRLESLGSRNAGAWLTAYPTTPDLSLSNSEFCLAARLRLGLPTYDDLPELCACNDELALDPAHFLSCKLLRGSAVTERHNMLVRLLAQLFRTKAGAAVRVTPKMWDAKRWIPDLQVIRAEGDLFLDVVVSHPSAPSRGTTRALAVWLRFQCQAQQV